MYTLKMSYGDVGDEPEMATTDILGTYESLDEACEAAQSEFSAIMGRLGDDPEVCVGAAEACLDDYYVTYGCVDYELGYNLGYEHYYRLFVVER